MRQYLLSLPRLSGLSLAAIAPVLLGGCSDLVVLDPAGDVAQQQGDLVIISTLLMLIIIIPVIALTLFFAWKYRADNKEARYEPDWDHSTQLELVIWAAPLLIIICLGALTWVGTHLLDPYRPLARTEPGVAVSQDEKPLEVQVVALDWKWLFIYPEQGIATVNEFAAPMDRPVSFRITGASVMNSFYIPAMAGQIYSMPGMETKLNAVFNKPGDFVGFSANYSGHGFSDMRFAAKSLTDDEFTNWVAKAKASGETLDRKTYLELEKPSEKEPVHLYASADPELFDAIVNMCVEPGKMCMHQQMAIDDRGGMGLAGLQKTDDLVYDKTAARGTGAPADWSKPISVCLAPEKANMPGARPGDAPVALDRLNGLGLPRKTGIAPSSSSDALLSAAAETVSAPTRSNP
ncbi:ubiquinol oxidase subunit II [Altericroceibacterium spongiae]|uniref:Ubiquinol oxidase polypeptide II n=1 Tax=Altericroceibacterium spongiae TaxID=2320269 RepID=A0A420EAE5_9SPHN|nr:ubiquinol oxidase subunit II [Altericroceibacterium spongiae]RKF17658.1 ubiquinol oxidase subunit II [Altericroceibacterium spongiae]